MMFKDVFDSLCFYFDLMKIIKFVNFFYSKEEDNDLGFLFCKLKKIFMCFFFYF